MLQCNISDEAFKTAFDEAVSTVINKRNNIIDIIIIDTIEIPELKVIAQSPKIIKVEVIIIFFIAFFDKSPTTGSCCKFAIPSLSHKISVLK